MVSKVDFTSEEWQQIIIAPQMASLYVALASPSGPLGVAKEMIAPAKMMVEAIKSGSGNALIDAVVADLREKAEHKEKIEAPQISKDPNEAKALCLQASRDLAGLLAQKAPEEAEGYKQWVYQAAQHSVEAAKEGGFLGIGGTRVSEAEAAALKEIASALGIAA